jgi:hypothetical protein
MIILVYIAQLFDYLGFVGTAIVATFITTLITNFTMLQSFFLLLLTSSVSLYIFQQIS